MGTARMVRCERLEGFVLVGKSSKSPLEAKYMLFTLE